MRWMLSAFTRLWMIVLAMTLLKISLELTGLSMYMDEELDSGVKAGVFIRERMLEDAANSPLIDGNKILAITTFPDLGVAAEGLGTRMEITVMYVLEIPFLHKDGVRITIKRVGVNTGYYGRGYLFE